MSPHISYTFRYKSFAHKLRSEITTSALAFGTLCTFVFVASDKPLDLKTIVVGVCCFFVMFLMSAVYAMRNKYITPVAISTDDQGLNIKVFVMHTLHKKFYPWKDLRVVKKRTGTRPRLHMIKVSNAGNDQLRLVEGSAEDFNAYVVREIFEQLKKCKEIYA